MSFHRARNSKRLQYHGASGRFARAPSLESQGLVKVCPHCRSIIPRPPLKVDEQTGFIDPMVSWPTDCPQCSKPLAEQHP